MYALVALKLKIYISTVFLLHIMFTYSISCFPTPYHACAHLYYKRSSKLYHLDIKEDKINKKECKSLFTIQVIIDNVYFVENSKTPQIQSEKIQKTLCLRCINPSKNISLQFSEKRYENDTLGNSKPAIMNYKWGFPFVGLDLKKQII